MKKSRNVLFVCQANENRSPTAELIFKEMLVERGHRVWNANANHDSDVQVLSAGMATYYGRMISQELGDWADEIYVMSEGIKEELVRIYKQDPKKIVNFDIPDDYSRNDPNLVALLRVKLEGYL